MALTFFYNTNGFLPSSSRHTNKYGLEFGKLKHIPGRYNPNISWDVKGHFKYVTLIKGHAHV